MREKHPYGEFIPRNAKAMIIGSFPIAKFSNPKNRHEIKTHEFDFFFGGEKNLLWKLLGEVFDENLKSREDVVKLLTRNKLAIGDVILSCRRKNGGGSDADLYDIKWNHKLLLKIDSHKIRKVYFTSKKVEVWFNRLFPNSTHLEKITLISPSGQSVRSVPRHSDYAEWLQQNPDASKYEFILNDYRSKFETDV